ncbi:MAG: TRAP transporter large permease, partial [Rhodobacteraceae bacterium]|nr:TRAP transporter large permease [Paracoccaceae bacterium]
MSALGLGGVGMVVLFVLMLLQVPIGFAMLIVGVTGFAMLTDWGPALALLASEPSGLLANVELATVPLFLLMGTFATVAGFSADIYNAAAAVLGHRRGGLGYATIGGCATFGAVCGSSTATAATFTRAALPEMLARGYAPSFATGTIAAGGTLKALIPPSIVMILYCIISGTFIFDMFVAAIVPALLALTLNIAAVWITVRLNPDLAPVSARMPWSERWPVILRAMPVLALLAAVFFGLYSGVFTVNEAASVAAVLSFLFALARGRLSAGNLWLGLKDTAAATAMIYMIIIGATMFSYFITLARVPEALINLVGATELAPLSIIFLILGIYLILGAVFDEISAMLITLPFVLPIIEQMNFDLIWWGIINVVVIEIGMITPPIGIIVFILYGMSS